MYQLPQPTKDQFEASLNQAQIPLQERRVYRKWFAYYWDFCVKYSCSIDELGSLDAFLTKLAQKKQSIERRAQAKNTVMLYLGCHKADSSIAVQAPRTAYTVLDKSNTCPWDDAFAKLAITIKTRHYSPKTLKSYTAWLKQFRAFVKEKDLNRLQVKDVSDFLSWLAVEQNVAAASQNQALNALLFFFKHVLKRPMGKLKNTIRAKSKPYIPVALSRQELDRIFAALEPPYDLIVK